MKISYFVENYTNGKGIFINHITGEIKEVFEEVVKFNFDETKEEIADVLAFTQMYLYCKFGVNGSLWNVALPSFNKFMARKAVWVKMYKKVGLDENVSNFCGNPNRKEKVIKHLANFGVGADQAVLVYSEVIQ
jgi:hypothetical protein